MTNFNHFKELCEKISTYNESTIPLCAAENVVSPFAKIPLNSFVQEKYIMGGIQKLMEDHNFMEAEYLFSFYEFINKQCSTLFNSTYADPRALSGVHAVMILLMSIFKSGDTVLISSEDSGGHSSMPKICKRLGIITKELPFDFEKMDFDYSEVNKLLREEKIAGVLICPSDLLVQPAFEKMVIPEECIVIYDATQTLGLMAGKVNKNPLNYISDETQFILMGATHKTLPGPTCGLVLTRNIELPKKFDTIINPDYLRNVQFHHILSLCAVLLEMEQFGKEYGEKIIENANYLAELLESEGFTILKKDESQYTETHQIFISMDKDDTEKFVALCKELHITLNGRSKKLYRNCGVRLGVQEITRYGWEDKELQQLAKILSKIKEGKIDASLRNALSELSSKKSISSKYSLGDDMCIDLRHSLHNC